MAIGAGNSILKPKYAMINPPAMRSEVSSIPKKANRCAPNNKKQLRNRNIYNAAKLAVFCLSCFEKSLVSDKNMGAVENGLAMGMSAATTSEIYPRYSVNACIPCRLQNALINLYVNTYE
ncbi:hypothetical protein GLIP_1381 [Aliiglaciecola lipolytica E3]|uniref:Uncharacterized protein n=1 Tax=Aliiglaciecola lipolytica E3 TaxID=1127673 RepID=K6Y726_9ALTE|nr:hypothetical protein GLIP_1381 [Aliiglaciecola lipolytica E3]